MSRGGTVGVSRAEAVLSRLSYSSTPEEKTSVYCATVRNKRIFEKKTSGDDDGKRPFVTAAPQAGVGRRGFCPVRHVPQYLLQREKNVRLFRDSSS